MDRSRSVGRLILAILIAGCLGGCAGKAAKPVPGERQLASKGSAGQRYVHLMHLDGFHPELFRILLTQGRLPHFAQLVRRGKLSLKASTVDKSETMKIIQAYLTSRRQTEVTGWWQFERDTLRFRNYDTQPIGLLDYVLGTKFPRNPTVYDVIAGHGENIVAGFTLHRRGVPFQNYARNYYEGVQGVKTQRYFDQAHATMSSFLATLKNVAADPRQKFPVMTTSLLAPADEMAHWRGIALTSLDGIGTLDGSEFCVSRKWSNKARKKDPLERIFLYLDPGSDVESVIKEVKSKYFTRVEYTARRHKGSLPEGAEARKFCFHIPWIKTFAQASQKSGTDVGEATKERVEPLVVLGMMVVDIELGRLLSTFRSMPVGAGETLFDRTLFVLMGDHGFADTKHGMWRAGQAHTGSPLHPDSLRENFIELLNRSLGLQTAARDTSIADSKKIGVDDHQQPLQFQFVHRDRSWQTPAQVSRVDEAEQWVAGFLDDLTAALKGELYKKYWFLGFLRKLLIDPKLEKSLKPYRRPGIDFLTQVYLHSDPEWIKAEEQALRGMYDRSVRLVYGGAARSNAEIFLPAPAEDGSVSWARRPTFDEIMNYRPGGSGAKRLMQALVENPGIGLIFVRKNNGQLEAGVDPKKMEVAVFDRFGNSGTITAYQDRKSGEHLFHYRKNPGSKVDPLGTGTLGEGKGTIGTYNDWNDWSVERDFYYHNVVGGMGDYLYTANPSVGDVSLMRSQGWNFADNGGSHGGIHKEEKLTVMVVSGPGVGTGELFAQSKPTYRNGRVSTVDGPVAPTVLDMAPTVLHWLGYGENALGDFARGAYPAYLEGWVNAQRADVAGNIDQIENLNQVLREAGFSKLRLTRFRTQIERLLQFIPEHAPALPSFKGYRADGNLLRIAN